MGKIKFVGFGGLNERGKQCYALTVNGNIYLFNCGLSTPVNAQLGIKKIIPDFNWIVENANAIKGIFIGTPKYDNYAGLPYLLKHIPNLPIYVSDVGANIIIGYFNYLSLTDKANYHRPNIKIMNPLVTQQLGGATITPFYLSNFLPKSFGFAINTPDGGIVYIDDFMISSNRNAAFEDQIFQINSLTKNNNLALLVGVGNVGINKGFTNPSHRTADFFSDILSENEDGRTLIACNDYDLYTIMTIASICSERNRPFIIYSRSVNQTFQFLCKKNYFKNKKVNFIKDTDIMTTKNAVIVITAAHQKLFNKIESILNDEDPKFKILPTDYFVYAMHTVSGYEKLEATMFDHIVYSNAKKIIKLPKETITASASVEDHKFLIDLLRPKYAIPLNGLYMNFVQYRNAVSRSFIQKANILMLSNGQMIEFDNGILQRQSKHIKQQLQFVNLTGTVDSGSASIFEREQMASDGVLLIDLLIDKQNKTVTHHNFSSVGVININDENTPIINEINETCLKLINENLQKEITDPSKPLNTKEFKYFIKKIFTKYYDKKFEKKPLVVTTLVFKKEKQNIIQADEE